MKKMEKFLESSLYFARWLLAPVYFGLSIVLLMLSVKFFVELYHTLPNILTISETDLVLLTLSLVDLSLVGGLVIMIMISGYENFISVLDISSNAEKLRWLGTMNASSLKMKVSASIVAISSIHLLRIFMDATQYETSHLLWYVVMHLTFVVSAFAMGILDKISHPNKH